jgi:hypothetical protein
MGCKANQDPCGAHGPYGLDQQGWAAMNQANLGLCAPRYWIVVPLLMNQAERQRAPSWAGLYGHRSFAVKSSGFR